MNCIEKFRNHETKMLRKNVQHKSRVWNCFWHDLFTCI